MRIVPLQLRKRASLSDDDTQPRCRLEEMAAPYYILKKMVLTLSNYIYSSSRTCLLLRQLLLHVKPIVAAPRCLLRKGFEPIIASPAGGKIPLDPRSTQEGQLSATSKNFLKDSKRLSSGSPADQHLFNVLVWPFHMRMTSRHQAVALPVVWFRA